MANFRIGQQVIFVGGDDSDPECILPIIGEEVTIIGYDPIDGGYELDEYPMTMFGHPQFFTDIELRAKQLSAIKDLVNSFVEVKETSDAPIKELV